MSYDIDSVEYLTTGRLVINRARGAALRTKHLNDLPEGCFLTDPSAGRDSTDLPGFIVIEKPWWYSEGSGRSLGVFKAILAETLGSADLLLTWAGGDSHSGIRVNNGTVTEMDVIFALKDKS